MNSENQLLECLNLDSQDLGINTINKEKSGKSFNQENQGSDLPPSWIEAKLGDVCTKPQYGWTTKSSKVGSIRYLRTTDISSGNINWDSVPFCDEVPSDIEKFLIYKNDILVSRAGSVGLSFLIDTVPFDTVFASYLIRFNPNQFTIPKWISLYFQSQGYWNQISENTAGIAIPNVNASKLSEITIPIPPLNEQKRIVEKLEKIIPKAQSCKKRLEKIPLILKRFRKSVLSAACSGELTRDWRERNDISFDEWQFKRAEEVCELITKGTTPTNNGIQTNGEIPYLKVYNIVDQKINFTYKPQYVSREIHNNFLKRSRVYPNDILMNIVGPPLGKVAIVPNDFGEWNINQAIAFFRPKEILLSDFVYIILCEGTPITEIEKEYRGTAGQSNISLEQCRNFTFPIPPLEEQTEIVKRIESLFSIADKIEERYKKAKKQVDKIQQSVLAKAFRGELVPQDPNDEAVVLPPSPLERGNKKKNNSFSLQGGGGGKKKGKVKT